MALIVLRRLRLLGWTNILDFPTRQEVGYGVSGIKGLDLALSGSARHAGFQVPEDARPPARPA